MDDKERIRVLEERVEKLWGRVSVLQVLFVHAVSSCDPKIADALLERLTLPILDDAPRSDAIDEAERFKDLIHEHLFHVLKAQRGTD